MGPIVRAVMELELVEPGLGDSWKREAPRAYRSYEPIELGELADSWTMCSRVRRELLLLRDTGIRR